MVRMLLSFLINLALIITFVNAKKSWLWENIREPHCINCRCMASTSLKQQVPNFTIKGRQYEVLSSQLAITQATLRHSKKSIKSDQGMKTYCSVKKEYMKSDILFGSWSIGEKSKMKWQCHNGNCTRVKGNKKQGAIRKIKSKISPTDEFLYQQLIQETSKRAIAWHDNDSVMLVTACTGHHGYSFWYVYSSQKYLSTETKKQIIKIVQKLGFDPKKAVDAYQDCP